MVSSGGITFQYGFGDDLIAVGAGENGSQDFRLSFLISDPQHIGCVRKVIQCPGCAFQLLAGHGEFAHIAPVNIHLSLGEQSYIFGKELDRLRAFSLGDTQGEHLSIFLQIEEILDDVVPELLLIQRAILKPQHEGVFAVSRPNILCGR